MKRQHRFTSVRIVSLVQWYAYHKGNILKEKSTALGTDIEIAVIQTTELKYLLVGKDVTTFLQPRRF
jgi:hypothetical protein